MARGKLNWLLGRNNDVGRGLSSLALSNVVARVDGSCVLGVRYVLGFVWRWLREARTGTQPRFSAAEYHREEAKQMTNNKPNHLRAEFND